MDFTLKKYSELVNAILENGYVFQTVEEFVVQPASKCVVLRHDSDIWPKNDLAMAQTESKMGVRATYYFRVPETFNPEIISEIKQLQHEIGYHYEDLARFDGDYDLAIKNFERNLNNLRTIYPVKTVARHGRPLSKWESLDLWKKTSLQNYDLIAEPYLSVDYSKVLYLTDNGSKWNATKDNIRDKVSSGLKVNIRTTDELIEYFRSKKLPDQVILNIHPARWNDNVMVWLYRFVLQKIKNVAKYFLNKIRN